MSSFVGIRKRLAAFRTAANRFRIPTKEDIAALQKRLDAVTERVDALSKQESKEENSA